MQELDLQYAPIGVNPVVHISQYDVGRQFKLKIYDGATAYSMSSGTTARIDGLKPDGNAFSYTDAVSVSGNVATITTKDQMTVLSGTVICELRFINGGNTIGTINFKLEVEKSPINADTPISDTEIPAIIELGRSYMLESEAWAVGTKDGVAVESDDAQYHNNSKYYSQQASQKATNAANSATASANSATASANSAINSANSATLSESWAIGGTNTRSGEDINNSKYYSQQSASSATASANSASSARTSEQAAKVSEDNAKMSETILDYYAQFVIPRFTIANNRLYISNAAQAEFIVANNRLYIKNAS
jgi:hypothetical protein